MAEATLPNDDAPSGDPEPAGWDALAALTGGIPPDQVDEFRAVRALEPIYPLLHALVGRSLRDLLVRAAVLEALVQAGRPAFQSADLDEVLSFLNGDARESAVAALRRSGWLEHIPSLGTVVTDAGRWAFDILAFLHKRVEEAELLPTVAGLGYALQIGVDPVRHLLSMRARLIALRASIDAARASHSEVVLRRTARRIDEALRLSVQIRAALDRVPLGHAAARAVSREIHGLLAHLHGAGAELHQAVTEVGRQYLALTGGLTTEQIVRALMVRSQAELASVARQALLPVTAPPPFVTTDVLASSAEQQALREHPTKSRPDWSEPKPAPVMTGEEGAPEDVRSLLAVLSTIAARGGREPLADVVDHGHRAESFLRLSLLALVGDARAGEGIAGQLGALPVDVLAEGDGWPASLEGRSIQRLTPGAVVARNGGEVRDG